MHVDETASVHLRKKKILSFLFQSIEKMGLQIDFGS